MTHAPLRIPKTNDQFRIKARNNVSKTSFAFETTSFHNMVMRTAKVSELRAKLSAYLAEVRGGARVVVYDRNTPKLVPFSTDEDDLVIIEATAPISALKKIKGVRPRKALDIDRLLRDLRADQ
jgi:antitoxin (DNA-binding transcriptional repressor) of toxin-antitoxin stability system